MASTINASTSPAAIVQTADGTGILSLQTGNTTALTIDASQNVGIGTTSPTERLNVTGTIHATGAGGFPTTGVGIEIVPSVAGGDNYVQAYSRTASSWQKLNINALQTVFGTNGTERMRIDSSGNLLVGTTSSNARLSVSAPTGVAIDFRTTTTADPMYGIFNTGGSSGSAVYVLPCRFGSTQTFAGGVYWSGSVMQYTGTSDIRLKENIIDAGSGLDKLANIKVRSFDWKESGSHVDFGVIAQELEEVAPEAVAKGKDNEDGSIDTPYAVDTSVLVPAMIKAIQEQQTIINDLKARITALEGA